MTEKDFLIEEYKNASQLTFHVDEQRTKLINFFLSFMGIVLAGTIAFFKGDFSKLPFSPDYFIGILLFANWVLGITLIVVLARLRRVQLEHFAIINNIRKYFFENQYALWNVVQLSDKTLPNPNRKSGTYFWVLSIMIISSLLLPLSTYIILDDVIFQKAIVPLCLILYIGSLIVKDWLYIRYASPPAREEYSEENSPGL